MLESFKRFKCKIGLNHHKRSRSISPYKHLITNPYKEKQSTCASSELVNSKKER